MTLSNLLHMARMYIQQQPGGCGMRQTIEGMQGSAQAIQIDYRLIIETGNGIGHP